MPCAETIRRRGFLVVLVVTLILLSFGASLAPHKDGGSFYASAAHAHDGGRLHVHVDSACDSGVQTAFAPKTEDIASSALPVYAFILPENPIFLLDPPPEVA